MLLLNMKNISIYTYTPIYIYIKYSIYIHTYYIKDAVFKLVSKEFSFISSLTEIKSVANL